MSLSPVYSAVVQKWDWWMWCIRTSKAIMQQRSLIRLWGYMVDHQDTPTLSTKLITMCEWHVTLLGDCMSCDWSAQATWLFSYKFFWMLWRWHQVEQGDLVFFSNTGLAKPFPANPLLTAIPTPCHSKDKYRTHPSSAVVVLLAAESKAEL